MSLRLLGEQQWDRKENTVKWEGKRHRVIGENGQSLKRKSKGMENGHRKKIGTYTQKKVESSVGQNWKISYQKDRGQRMEEVEEDKSGVLFKYSVEGRTSGRVSREP